MFAKNESQLVLAKRTIEILKVMDIAQYILKQKFNDNSCKWLDAVLEALAVKNSEYLLEEKSSPEVNFFDALDSKLDESFWNRDNYDEVVDVGSKLVNIFNKLMTGLNKNSDMFELENSFSELGQIERNIRSFVVNPKSRKINSLGDTKGQKVDPLEDLNSQKIDPLDLNSQKIEPLEDSSDENESGNVEWDCQVDYNKSNSQPLICDDCNAVITIFNNDVDFSISLHLQETAHEKAVAKKKAGNQVKAKMSLEDENAIRAILDQKINQHSAFMKIISDINFFCTLCDCQISSMHNVISHVEGKTHKKNCEMRKKKRQDVLRTECLLPSVSDLY